MPRREIAEGNSCRECRRRKIKCDRAYPCSYCVKKNIDCAYPPPKAQPGTDSELLTRVERIEQRFLFLEQRISDIKQLLQSWSPVVTSQAGITAPVSGDHYEPQPPDGGFGTNSVGSDGISNGSGGQIDNMSDAAIYVNNRDIPSPAQGSSRCRLLFESSKVIKLETLRPRPAMISFLWLKYLENIDRVLKIFHTPSVQKLVMEAIGVRHKLDAASDAMLFSIYYATVVGLSVSECKAELGEERQVLLQRYRTGLECSLARANFADDPNMMVLQAFVIFLITGRRDERGPDVHSLTGLAIGLALKIGLNRDGESQSLPPFEVEMRRRLWWQICILDVHTAEENGCDPIILEPSFNTKLPCNIADSSLDPDMSETPQSATGRTEMLFSLLQIEVSYFARQLLFSKKFVEENSYTPLSGAEKCEAIDLFQKRIERQYLSYCNTNVPFDFVTATFTRFILVKLKLAVSRSDSENEDPRMKENLRTICIQILDYSNTIRSCENGRKPSSPVEN